MPIVSSSNLTTLYSGSNSPIVPAQPYGNANVVGLLAAGTDGANTVGNIVAAGNVSATYFLGNGALLTGVASSYGDANVEALLAGGTVTSNVITAGNISGNYILGNGSQLTGLAATYNDANVVALLASFGSNTINTTGAVDTGDLQSTNISSTGFVSATGNVLGANFVTSGVVTATGNVRGGNINTAGAVSAGGNVIGSNIIGNGQYLTNLNAANVSGSIANATYANTAGTASYVTAAAQANITSVGTLTSLTVSGNVTGGNVATAGQVSAGGNVTGSNFIGNGQYLTNLPAANISGTVANATYATTAGLASYVTANAQANITSVGTLTSLTVSGNITGANINGNGSGLSSLTGANVTGTVANATYAVSAGSATTAVTVTANAQPNITSVGILSSLSVTGNITSNATISTAGNVEGGNLITSGSFVAASLSATGNITGSNVIATTLLTAPQMITTGPSGNISNANYITAQYFVGDGGLLSNISASSSAAGSNTQVQYNNAGVFGADADFTFNSATNTLAVPVITATGNITGGNLVTAGLVTATGNINGANLVAAANLTSTQQTVVGTANVGTTGNIVVSGKNIATDMAFNPDGGNAATAATARVVVGTGWSGNITHSSNHNRLAVADAISRTNTGTQVRSLMSEQFVTLNGNVTNSSFRQQTLGGYLRVGGGSAANTTGLTNAVAAPFSLASGQFNLDIGNISPYNLGNTTISHGLLNGGVFAIAPGSQLTNGLGTYNLVSSPAGSSNTGNLVNYIGFTSSVSLTNAATGNIYMFYTGNSSSASATNTIVTNTARQAPDYYAFYNADDHAQVRLGSLKYYNEFRYDTATSGTVNISKLNGQVQYIRPTGNVTIGDFQNFVTETTDGATYDQQTDTLTIVIAQSATPYTITMPTGNAQIKYASGNATVANTANAVTMISVTAANIASTKTYMVTISPEFS